MPEALAVIDRYRKALSDAQWTWNEGKHCRFHKPPRRKERAMGRHDKRAAKAKDRRETREEASERGTV